MDYPEEKSRVSKKDSSSDRMERLVKGLEFVSLNDVSLEDRRREARKPLFLTRYE